MCATCRAGKIPEGVGMCLENYQEVRVSKSEEIGNAVRVNVRADALRKWRKLKSRSRIGSKIREHVTGSNLGGPNRAVRPRLGSGNCK